MYCRQHRVVVNDDLENEGNVPAPLNLPFGKLFFGFHIPSYVPPPAPEEAPSPEVCACCTWQFLSLLTPQLAPVFFRWSR